MLDNSHRIIERKKSGARIPDPRSGAGDRLTANLNFLQIAFVLSEADISFNGSNPCPVCYG